MADGPAADPAANREAETRPVAERPRDRTAANDPAPERPAPERPVTDRPVTDGHAGDRPENGGAADTLSVRDTRDDPADSDDVQAKIADLLQQLADSKSELQAERARNADLETQLTAEKARNADLASQVTDRDARLDAANARLDEQDAKIAEQATGLGALTETVERQGDVLQSVLQRMERAENAGADGPARDADVRGAPQPEVLAAPDAARDSEDEKLDGRYVGDDAQLADRQKPSWYQRGPVDSTLAFTSTGLGTGLTGLSHFMTSELGWGATLAGGIASFAFAGVTWLRDRRKRRNAD